MSEIAEVVTLYDVNSRDIPAMLRELADAIEAGLYGEVLEVALAMWADRLRTFGWGPTQDGGSSHILFSAAAHSMLEPVLRHGRD